MHNPPSLLVVDDEPNNFDAIEALLYSEGYQLHYAPSGQRALAELDLFQPDVILLDVMMPELDGIEVCQRIKADPTWQAVPVVMVTALTDKADLARCLAAGADDFISKPLNGLELRARVGSMLRIKHQYDELQALLELRSAASERRYATLAAAAPVGIFRTDRQGNCMYVNQRWCEITGLNFATALNLDWRSLALPEEQKNINEILALTQAQHQPFRHEYRLLQANGNPVWVFGQVVAERDERGQVSGYVGTLTDINALKQAQASLAHHATHDSLTQLANRSQFLMRLEGAIARCHRADVACELGSGLGSDLADAAVDYAVLFLDLDRFKIVNDSLGHLAGDRLLVEIARKVQATLGPTHLAARIGGDEFAILLELFDPPALPAIRAQHRASPANSPIETAASFSPAPCNSTAAQATDPPAPRATPPTIEALSLAIAEHLLSDFQAPVTLDGHQMYLGLSIGIVLGGPAYGSPYDLLRDADIAMYRAKANGGNTYQVFDAAMHAQAVERLTLEADLRQALEVQEFLVYYQPIIDLASQCPIGCEALVRWQHPRRGFVSPVQFVPIAEETGLIVPLDRWVLRTAVAQLVEWQKRFNPRLGLPALKVSVNLSAADLRQVNVLQTIDAILEQTGLPPESLTLEITESIMIQNIQQAIELLGQLKTRGVQISLDDFGTGYSSLSYLHQLPADILKIDRSFVGQMQAGHNQAGQALSGDDLLNQRRNQRNYQVVSAILALSNRLGLRVVAEGIETAEQLQLLQDLGCDYGQGYFFAKPLPPEEMANFLERARNPSGEGQLSGVRL